MNGDPAREKRLAELAAEQAEWGARADEATRKAAQSLSRLLALAENRGNGQTERVARFLGAIWNGRRHFDLFDLRAVDVQISDDMLAVLDGLRWGRISVEDMVPNGGARIRKTLDRFDLLEPER